MSLIFMDNKGVVATVPQCNSPNTYMKGGSHKSVGRKMIESGNWDDYYGIRGCSSPFIWEKWAKY